MVQEVEGQEKGVIEGHCQSSAEERPAKATFTDSFVNAVAPADALQPPVAERGRQHPEHYQREQ